MKLTRHRITEYSKRVVALLLLSLFLVGAVSQPIAYAITPQQKSLFRQHILYFDHDQSAICNQSTTNAAEPGTNTNLDYAGNTILTKPQLDAIAANTSVYQQAATKAGIPWQMLAVIHLRETNLGKSNPSNGQGIYQFVDKRGGPYPTGPVSDAEFLRQTTFAAEFLKEKARSNYQPNWYLTPDSPPEAVKDTFFSYNGRAGVYAAQARSLGFTEPTQGYEGSPYVMNKADAKRDPAVAPDGTWGQVKRDFGPIEYPANNDYGAFVTYGALAGIAAGGSCSSTVAGTVREKVVALARQELELWESGQLKPGSGYFKYSQNRQENWCADFVSWIYNQAEYPLKNGNEGNVPAVSTIKAIGEQGGRFTYHPVGSYKPQVGDIVIQKFGVSHTNIVVAVEDVSPSPGAWRITVIGGNQGGTSGFNTSKVTEYTMMSNNIQNTGFVSPAGG